MDEKARQALAEKTRAAFPRMKKLPDSRLIWDRDELPRILGKRCDHLTIDDLNYSPITFLTVDGSRYYLPAFLEAAILYPDKMETASWIMYALSPPTHWPNLVSEFTAAQKAVIREFFEVYEELYPTDESLLNSRVYFERQKFLEEGLAFWKQHG